MTFDREFSIKEVGLAAECLRKWAAQYLHRCPDPKGQGAQDSIDLHALLEDMCDNGPERNVQPESKIGKWARALYPLTPRPCRTEIRSTFDLFGYRASFKIDFVREDFEEFGDWKANKDAERWRVKDLKQDLQANWEANGFMKVFGRQSVQLRWLYVDKATSRALPPMVDVFTLEQTEAWLHERALPWMRLIEALRSVPMAPVQAYPLDARACRGKGQNCNFMGPCQFRPASTTVEHLLQLAAQPRPKTQE